MKNNIFALIKEKGNALSKGQRAIAKYILENGENAAFQTAGRMAKTVGVSESTVVRFALELGYEGYPQMQRELQELVLKRLTPEHDAAAVAVPEDDMTSMALRSDMERIRNTVEQLDQDVFAEAVKTVLDARRVYILSNHAGVAIGFYLEHHLRMMLKSVTAIYDDSVISMGEKLADLEAHDAVIVVSFCRHTGSLIRCAELCIRFGAKIIAFTDSQPNALRDLANFVLTADCQQFGLLDSLTAPMSMANAFVASVAAARSDELKLRMRKLERIRVQCCAYDQTKGSGHREV